MKNLILLALAALALPLIADAQNIPMKNYFCALDAGHQGVLCSEIKKGVAFLAPRVCAAWAQEQGMPLAGVFSNANADELYKEQKEVCDSLPGKAKWHCYMIVDCGNSSSEEFVGEVFAPLQDLAGAKAKCVDDAWPVYKNALKNLGVNCKMAPDAVALQF